MLEWHQKIVTLEQSILDSIPRRLTQQKNVGTIRKLR